MADNFHIDIAHEGDLKPAMRIAFAGAAGGKAEGYAIDPDKGLVFFWAIPRPEDPRIVPLPFKLDADGAADFAERWLSEQSYGKQPDHDGDNGRGWRIYNEAWAQVQPYGPYGFVAVKPCWMMYGK